MASVIIEIAEGDSGLDFAFTLTGVDGNPYDLSDKTTVCRFTRKSDAATVHVPGIISGDTVLVPQGAVTTGPGTYYVELQVLQNGVLLTTQPTDGGWRLIVRALETQ